MHAFYLGDADAYGGNIEADGDIGIGTGSAVRGFDTKPGNCRGGKLHQGIGLAAFACWTLTQYLNLCGQASTGTLCNDCSYLVGNAIEGGDIGRTYIKEGGGMGGDGVDAGATF